MSRGDVKITITGDKSKLQSALKGAGDDLGGFEGKASGWATKLGTIAAAGAVAFGAAFVGVGAGLFALGNEFDGAYDSIRVGTGATGDTLAGLQDDLKAVVSNVPTDFATAGTAIADLNTRLGLSGEPLQALSTQFLDLSRITGTDVATNIDQVTRVFGDWGVAVDDQATTMDKLFRASQASGIGLDDLQGSLVQFGAPLRNLGFGIDESMALLAQFNKTGVNTETVFAGLKAGVGKLAKAGEDVPTTFKRVVGEITAMGPGTEATAKAIELFGQRAGPDLADAIAGGKFEIDAMLGAITNGTDTIASASADTADFGEKFQVLKNRVFVGLEPLATGVFNAIGDGLDKVGPLVETAVGGITAFAAAFRAGGNDVTSSGFAGKLEAFGLKAREVFDRVSEVVKRVGPIVARVLVGALKAAGSAIAALGGFIGRNIGTLKTLGMIVAGAAAGFAALMVVRKLVAIFQAAKAAVLALNIAMAANPAVLIALAIGALVAAIVAAYFRFEEFRKVIDTIGRWIQENLWPILQAVGAWIAGTLLPIIMRIASFIGQVFVAHVRNLMTVWSAVLWPALQAVGGWITGTLWPVLRTVAEFIGQVFVAHVRTLVAFWSGTLWPALKAVGAWITGTLVPIIQRIASTFASIASSVAERVSSIVSTVLSIGGRIAGFVSGMWRGIGDGIARARDTVQSVVDGVVGIIRGIGGRLGDVASAISSPFSSAFGAVKRLWNSTVGGFSFSIPSWVPGVGGKGFSIPNMHVGGVVPGFTGGEQLTMLEAGESVRTRQQEARLQSIIGGLAHGAANAQPAATLVVNITGPVARDSRRWIMDELEQAVAAGMGSPRLRRSLNSSGT